MTDHIEVLQGMLDHYGDNPLHFTLEKASLRAAIAALRAHPSEPQVAKRAGIYCSSSQRVAIVEQHEWPEGGFRNVWITYAEEPTP